MKIKFSLLIMLCIFCSNVFAFVGSIYNAANGFSPTAQGENGWYYEFFNPDSGEFELMQYHFSSTAWTDNEPTSFAILGRTFVHPGNDGKHACRTWVSPHSGAVRIDGTAKRDNIAWSNGVKLIVKNGDSQNSLYEEVYGVDYSGSVDTSPISYTVYEYISEGDKIRFIADALGNTASDGSTWNINITYIDYSEMPYAPEDVKMAVFKENGLVISDEVIPTEKDNVFSVEMMVENRRGYAYTPTIIIALYTEENKLCKLGYSNSVSILRNEIGNISASLTIPDGVNVNYRAKAFLLDSMENISPLAETITFPYHNEGVFLAEADYSSTEQGVNNWYYEYYDANSQQYEQMQYHYTAHNNEVHWRASEDFLTARMGSTFVHPGHGGSMNVSRTWVVPQDGAVKIYGSAKRLQTAWSNGVRIIVKNENSSGSIYENTYGLDYSGTQDTPKLSYTAYAYVHAGEKIRFIADAIDGNASADESIWSIMIMYIDEDEMPYPIFHMSDFGAVGDGVTDDSQAFISAIEIAKNGGEGTVLMLDKNASYKIGEVSDRWSLIYLNGANGLTIDGNGSSILFEKPTNTFAYINNSENITVKNLTIDYMELPFTQGTITNVYTESGSFDLEIHEGYPLPVNDAVAKQYHGSGVWRFGMIIDPERPRLKFGGADHNPIVSINHVSDRIYNVVISNDNELSRFAIDDRYVIQTGYSAYSTAGKMYSTHNLLITHSSNVLIDNVYNFSSVYMWCVLTDNMGDIIVRNSGILRKPETNRLMSGNSDGVHAKHNRGKIIVDNCTFEGNLDDAINISSLGAAVESIAGNREFYIKRGYGTFFKVGDRLMFYDSESSKKLAITHIEEIVYGETSIYIKTTDDISNAKADPNINPPMSSYSATIIYNLDALGPFEIKNNMFKEGRRHAALLRASNGSFINNTVIEMGGGAVYAANEIGTFSEGPFPSNIVVSDNFVENSNNSAFVFIVAGGGATPDRLVSDIVIKNNTVFNNDEFYRGPVRIYHTNGLSMENNTLYNQNTISNQRPMHIINSSNILLKGFDITDFRTSSRINSLVLIRGCDLGGETEIDVSDWTVSKDNSVQTYIID